MGHFDNIVQLGLENRERCNRCTQFHKGRHPERLVTRFRCVVKSTSSGYYVYAASFPAYMKDELLHTVTRAVDTEGVSRRRRAVFAGLHSVSPK